MVAPKIVHSRRRNNREQTESLKRPRQYADKSGMRSSTATMINRSGALFRRRRTAQAGKPIWIATLSSTGGQDDMTTETERAESSSSGRFSLSSSSRFSSDSYFRSSSSQELLLLDTSESTNEMPLQTIKEPLGTPPSRPIIKEVSKNERQLHIKKRRKSPCETSTSTKESKNKNTLCQGRTRSISVDFETETESNSTDDATSINNATKQVCFGTVEIRSYNQTLGDNPSVTFGPPIQLDWDYKEHPEIEINAYECQKSCRYKRNLQQLCMSYYKRKNLLFHEYGFDKEDLVQARRAANKIKFHRSVTTTMLPMRKIEEALESVGRKTKRLIQRTR